MLAAFSSAPAAASYFEGGVSFSRHIVRDGVPYKLTVKVVEDMASERTLRVTLRTVVDPVGRTAMRQTQGWNFDLAPTDVYSTDDGVHRIQAGDPMGPYHLDLTVAPREDQQCSSRQRLFVETSTGAFRIETGNPVFGTITEVPRCGSPYHYASGPTPGPPACPVAGHRLYSAPLIASEWRAGDVVRVAGEAAEYRTLLGREVTWFVEVEGTLPARRFTVGDRLDGSLDGRGAPWLSGRAVFRPTGPILEVGWYDCKRRREATRTYREVALEGDLSLEVIGEEPVPFADPTAQLSRAKVRPRS